MARLDGSDGDGAASSLEEALAQQTRGEAAARRPGETLVQLYLSGRELQILDGLLTDEIRLEGRVLDAGYLQELSSLQSALSAAGSRLPQPGSSA